MVLPLSSNIMLYCIYMTDFHRCKQLKLFEENLSNGNSTANLSRASFANVASTRASTRGRVFGAFRVDVVTRQTRRHSPSRVTRTRPDSTTFAEPCFADSPDSKTFAKPCCTDSPDSRKTSLTSFMQI
jgi:hypothetical protein